MMQENRNLFLPNSFLPPRLFEEKMYTAHSIALKKKEVNLEFPSLNLSQDYPFSHILRMPENRYRIHKNTPFSFLNSYSFCLKSFEKKTNTYNFFSRKKKRFLQSSFKEGFLSKRESALGKGRLLSTFLRGSKFSLNGTSGTVKKTLKKRRMKKKIKKQQRLSLNSKLLLFHLPMYGHLTPLHRFLWKIKEEKRARKKKKLFFRKVQSFLKKNRSFRPTFQLKQRKKDTVRFLIN